MARGVRKTPLEKLQQELTDIQTSIAQYESCIETMREKEKLLQDQINLEEVRAFKSLLNNHSMILND